MNEAQRGCINTERASRLIARIPFILWACNARLITCTHARATGQVRVIRIPCERTARNYTHVCRTSGQRLRAASNARRDKRVSRVTRKVLAVGYSRVIDPRCNRQASDITRLAGNTRKLHYDPLTYIACTNGPVIERAQGICILCVRTMRLYVRVCTILRQRARDNTP